MDMPIWAIWFFIAILFLSVEWVTRGGHLLWLGLGAIFGGLLALLGWNARWQWGAFVFIFILLTILIKLIRRTDTQ